MASTLVWQGIILVLLVCTGLSSAKPYHHKNEKHVNAKVFRDELVLPPSDTALYPEGGARWMSWDPMRQVSSEPTEEDSYSEESDEDEDEDEQVGEEEEEEEAAEDSYDEVEENVPAIDVSPSLMESVESSQSQSEDEMPIMETDPCKDVFCHVGRVCQATMDGRGECVCAPASMCAGHKKDVCGSDGQLYPSHCELHRTACIEERHIGIDRTPSNCKRVWQEHHREEHVVKEEVKVDKDAEEEESKVQVKVTRVKLIKANKLITDEDEEDEDEDEEKYEYAVQKDIKEAEPIILCSEVEYDHFKGILLQYHCARIGETNCSPNSPRKQFVANIMFNYYDRDSNQNLDEGELMDIERRDHLDKLSSVCGLVNLLSFNDENKDANISLIEFYQAFDVPTVILDEELKVFTTQVSTGNSIELKCDIKGASEIIWNRNGAEIKEKTSPEMKTFDDGSLYIRDLGLHHMANYSCKDRHNDHVIQTHVLHVQQPPHVRISPSTQFHTSGATVMLKCHADGIPEPELLWEMNEAPLPIDETNQHYVRLHNNATLEIRKAVYTKDTGAYKCKARNPAGTGQDIATVFIENSALPQYAADDDLYEVFVVFHDKGYTVYEPMHCHIKHQVGGLFDMFKIFPEYSDTIKTLCPADEPCSWGSAVNVRNKFIYITQPKQNRVVVIEIQDRSNPVEIIPTDNSPVSLSYVDHLDSVWVTCWNDHSENETGSKTLMVIRQASEDLKHSTVHTQPIANHFDLIEKVFIPNNNDLGHQFTHGYVVHNEQQGLHKLDLEEIKYAKIIDLKEHSCVPHSLAFIPLGGQVVVSCRPPAGQDSKGQQLFLDTITDAVLGKMELVGDAHVSPDGRFVVVIDDVGDTITIHKVTDNGGIEIMYDEYINVDVSDMTFFPGERGRSYDLYASSASKNAVLYMNLASGKVEMIEGVGQAIDSSEWPWSDHNRVIVGGGVFGEYLMTPSNESAVVIDGKRRHVQCEWRDITHGNVIVWVEPLHL